MAKEKEQKQVPEENVSEQLSEHDVFTDGAYKEFTEHEIFAGDENLYKLLEESDDAKPNEQIGFGIQPSSKSSIKLISLIRKVLIVCIVVVVGMLSFALLKPFLGWLNTLYFSNDKTVASLPKTTTDSAQANLDAGQTDTQQLQVVESEDSSNQSSSLTVARNLYEQGEFNKAFIVYQKMKENLPNVGEEELLRDFLQLKMALCANRAADYEQANHLLSLVCKSRSPAVRVISNYYLALLDIRKKQYLRARTRAYMTIALIKAVKFDDDWALSFECDCYFLAAECLTRHIYSLGNVDNDLPKNLWDNPVALTDPFDNLNESKLRRFLNSGTEYLADGILDPEVRKIEGSGGMPRWSVVSYGIPVEELLSKIASNAGFNINWTFEEKSTSDSYKDKIKQRPVSLYMSMASSIQILQVAAGCVGLLASVDSNSDKLEVTIFDPTEYSSLQEHINFLSRQAISLWEEFVIAFYSDQRLGNCHFAMGVLQSLMELPDKAISEYKLVANRFSRSPLAPFALLNSSNLKMTLRDHKGAREDLKQLIEQYPDTKIFGKAYLHLADATIEAGLISEAAQLYQRIYNFDLSTESNIAAAMGAAGCHFKNESYKDAVIWLIRYIELTNNDNSDNNLYSAYLLLGKSYLALKQYRQACDAFKYALAEQSSREQYVEAIQSLIKGHIEQGDFLEALNVLESIRSIALSQEQSVDMLILKSRVYRLLALIDTAVVLLRDRADFVTEPVLKAKISFELAMCYIASDKLELARNNLSDILGYVEPGPFSQKAALELADVCLKLNRDSQTITICLQLLDSNASEQIKQSSLELLATAYNRQGNYDKAALALSGRWE